MSLLEALPFEERIADTVADRLGEQAASKNPLCRDGSGMIGDDSIDDVSGEVAGEPRKPLEMNENSESSAERTEELDEALEADRISGALKA